MPKKKTTPTTTNNDVGEALALLSETLVDEEKRIRDEGADAMKSGAYDTATDVIDFAKKLLAFQSKEHSKGSNAKYKDLTNCFEKMPPTPKTLQVFLPEGTPAGIQIAELKI